MAATQHVVFLNVAETGHMNPTLPIVKELTSRGCLVTYFVEKTQRDVVEAAGAKWMPFRYPNSDFTGTLSSFDEDGLDELVPVERRESENVMFLPNCMVYTARQVLPALLEDLKAMETPPNVIVHDPFIAFGQVVGKVLSLPTVCTVTVPGPGVVAEISEMNKALEAKPWVSKPRQDILDRYGVDVFEHGLIFEWYSRNMNLVSTIEDIFAKPSPAQAERFGDLDFQCVGAMIDTKIKRIANANVDKSAWTDLPAEVDVAVAAGKRLLFLSLGTVATSHHFWHRPFGGFGMAHGIAEMTGKGLCQHIWRAAFDAFGNDPDVFVVMSLGPQDDALEGMPEMPSNFVCRKTVPQLEILQKCHAFVTHGGANSMHEALGFGMPLAVVPIFGDQPINADTVARLGVGVSFRRPSETVSAQSMREAVKGLLAEQNPYRTAAQGLAAKLKAAGGFAAAADAIMKQTRPGATGVRGGA